MNEKKFRVIILTHGGAERFIEILCESETIEIAGIFVETDTARPRPMVEKIKRSIRYDGYLSTIKKFAPALSAAKSGQTTDISAVEKGQSDLEICAARLNIPLTKVANYHSDEAIRLFGQAEADLGILYGTNIVKESVFNIPQLGSINIHQGLAPQYRGGPAVFWELYNNENEIGITVHFVASQVDTGDIILQKTVPLEYDFLRYRLDYEHFLRDFRASLIQPSAQLLAEAVRQIAEGKQKQIKQDTTIGKRYKLPFKSEKDRLLRILRKRSKAVERERH